MATNKNIIDKLNYLGLDLENIPDSIINFKNLEYRPSKYNDEHTYKVYRYINVNDIQILLTKTNRMCDISEKYNKAVPLYAYLNPNDEENIERHTKFLQMVSKLDESDIEEIETEQKRLNKKISFKIKYSKDYLWQIYYSEFTNQYFMLVPTEDLEQSAFFYVLKKQLENKNEKIFVPISHMDYTREYLTRMQISDLENYIWLFTKEWPLVYEVFDREDNLSINIVGKTNIYDDIKSDYRIILNSKENADKFFKLLKALFILQTQIPHLYEFRTSIDEKGSLQFNINDKKIIYEILPSFIKEEYIIAEDKKIHLMEEKMILEKELDLLQKKSSNLEKEYLDKEKEIAIFLECRKTFFGRMRYFFKYKKVKLVNKEVQDDKKQDVKIIRLNKYDDVKKNYTLEELVELYEQVDKETIKVRNLKSDIKAIEQRITNLESKVKNAKIYMQEIDEHKKSIFEFWKFTNKDKQGELPEGIIQEESKENLKKTFDYELDFEDLGISLDRKQRDVLTKEELESVFLATTQILADINDVVNKKEITEDRLDYLKKMALEENNLSENENFDIFGGISVSNKLQILANKKHRETHRQTFRILDITKNTTIQEYTEQIKRAIKNIESALNKIELGININLYKCDLENDLGSGYNIFSISAENAIKDVKGVNLYKVKAKEKTNIVALTNIVYYDNSNKTLPEGMNIKDGIILGNILDKLEPNKEEKINIVEYKDEEDELSDTIIKTINIKEYEIK